MQLWLMVKSFLHIMVKYKCKYIHNVQFKRGAVNEQTTRLTFFTYFSEGMYTKVILENLFCELNPYIYWRDVLLLSELDIMQMQT